MFTFKLIYSALYHVLYALYQVALSCFASMLLQCVVVVRKGIMALTGPLEACRLNAVASHAPLVTLFTRLQHNDFFKMCVCSERARSFTIPCMLCLRIPRVRH